MVLNPSSQMKTEVIALLSFVFLSALTGCFGRQPDKRLLRVDELASVSPEDALDSLCVIDYAGLPEADRHYYDLLFIKAADKAYKTHTSDSLVLDVIDYYSSHGKDDLYAEALYYGGRVYSDIGDSPTALRYFQSALEEVTADNENLDFRGNILSQTGRLLNDIRQHSLAIPYLEASIDIDRQLSDTFGLAYDNMLLGSIYMHIENYDRADSLIRRAVEYASMISPTDSANITMYLADIYRDTGNIDSALSIIRNLPDIVAPLNRNRALSSAALIYCSAGIPDTAYMYAHELARSSYFNNRHVGYYVLLSPELQDFVPCDSLRTYVYEYEHLLNSDLDPDEVQATLIQNSYYNYQKHVKERDRIKASRDRTIGILIAFTILGLVLFIVIISYRYESSKRLLKLHRAMSIIDDLRSSRHPQRQPDSESCDVDWNKPEGLQNIKDRLLVKIRSMANEVEAHEVSDKILRSQAYKEMKQLIFEGKGITSKSFWDELASTIELSSPGFKQKLQSLTNGRLSESDFQIALLIKCDFPPKDMAILLNKAKGTISSRREYLGQKIFGEKIGVTAIDNLIRCI